MTSLLKFHPYKISGAFMFTALVCLGFTVSKNKQQHMEITNQNNLAKHEGISKVAVFFFFFFF